MRRALVLEEVARLAVDGTVPVGIFLAVLEERAGERIGHLGGEPPGPVDVRQRKEVQRQAVEQVRGVGVRPARPGNGPGRKPLHQRRQSARADRLVAVLAPEQKDVPLAPAHAEPADDFARVVFAQLETIDYPAVQAQDFVHSFVEELRRVNPVALHEIL